MTLPVGTFYLVFNLMLGLVHFAPSISSFRACCLMWAFVAQEAGLDLSRPLVLCLRLVLTIGGCYVAIKPTL